MSYLTYPNLLEARERIVELEQQLAAEKAAREKAELQRDGSRQQRGNWELVCHRVQKERDELATTLSDAWEFIEDRASDYDDEGRAEFRAWVDGNVKSTPRAILAAHDAALVRPLVEALIQMRSLVRQLDYVDYELREAVTRLVDKALAAHKKGATE